MSDGRCACGRELSRLTVATKTQKFGKHLVVKKQEAALVCPDCGVIAFQSRPVTPLYGMNVTSGVGAYHA